MDIAEIRRRWQGPAENVEAQTAIWDASARHFGKKPIPNWDDDSFLEEIDRAGAIGEDMTVLDIGCGAGGYSIALSKRARHVTAVDLSPAMLECARENAQCEHARNISFLCMDWNVANLESLGMAREFDLVIAHMTPAVADAEAFLKMMDACRGWCWTARPARRSDSVLDELRRLAGIRPETDDGLEFAFALVWESGSLPLLSYHRETWEAERPLGEAKDFYRNKLLALGAPTGANLAAANAYLERLAAQNGDIVQEVTNTTIVTMGWQNTNREDQ